MKEEVLVVLLCFLAVGSGAISIHLDGKEVVNFPVSRRPPQQELLLPREKALIVLPLLVIDF